MSLAAGKDFVVATYPAHDEVRLLWPQDDAFVKTESVAVSKPVAAATAPDGRVFVVSPGRIVCITPGSHAIKPIAASQNEITFATILDDGVFYYDLPVMLGGSS